MPAGGVFVCDDAVARVWQKSRGVIGHANLGSGRTAVVVLNDWMCDTSTWDAARPYLDGVRFTWVFADLRGYGRSKGLAGEFTIEEAAADVIELTNTLGLPEFAIVGHSMSSLIALHLAQHSPDRIARAVLLTPPPPTGFGADESRLDSLRAVARGDDSVRLNWVRSRLGERWSEGWVRFKAERWRACADPEAVAGYAAMFARRGLPEPAAQVVPPALAVTGEQDIEIMRREAVTKLLASTCPKLEVVALADCGHYPMQEAPPLLVATVERFLRPLR
jgi:pimeloyl-ACP methyl ester carboxylesterase